MKKLFLLISCLTIGVYSIGQGVIFEDITIEEAIKKAKVEDKYIFIDVYTAWCGPCKMMEKQVFPLKEIGDYFNSHFINLKINAESEGQGQKFKKKYGIKAYPTFVILDKNGELTHMFAGGILDLTFIDKVAVAFDEQKAFGALKRKYEAGEKNPKVVASYLEALMNTHTANVTDKVDEFYATLSNEEKITKECIFIFDILTPLNSEREQFLRENIQQFRKIAGTEKIDKIYKTKYRNYFGNILQGYGGNVTKEDIKNTKEKIAELNLRDLSFLPIMRKAAMVKITESGKEELIEEIKATVPNLSKNDTDIMLYFTLPGLQDQFNKAEEEELLALMHNKSTKGYVTRSLKR